MNSDSLTYYCYHIIDLLYLLLLRVFLDIINFIYFQYFDSSIAIFIGLLKYSHLLTSKKLINLGCLACHHYYAIDNILCPILLLLSTPSCCHYLACFIVDIYLISLLLFVLLIDLTLVDVNVLRIKLHKQKG